MATTTKDLREQRAKLVHDANQILARAAQDDKAILAPADEESWNKIYDETESLRRHIEIREKQDALDQALEAPQPRLTESAAPETRSSGPAIRQYQRTQDEAHRALRLWLLGAPTSGYSHTADDLALLNRCGISLSSSMLNVNFSTQPMVRYAERDWSYRAQGVVSGSVGLYTVPDEMMRAIEVALLTFGGMRQRSTIIRTETGAALPIPTVNDTSNVGVILAENTQVANQDVAFGQLVLDAYKYSSKQVLVSVELLQDNAVNIGQLLGRLLGERIGRITNTHFTTGTGTSQPNGIVTAATAGYTASNGTTQVTTWTYGSMVELEHSVDPAYRSNAAFMMADSSVKKSKQLIDSQGRPLWAAGIANAAPDTLLGYPIVINQDMAAMAAGARSVLFGDLSKYLIRDVLGVTLLRLEERYADYHQVAFLAFARMDGDLLDAGTHPVKCFINAAS